MLGIEKETQSEIDSVYLTVFPWEKKSAIPTAAMWAGLWGWTSEPGNLLAWSWESR